MEKEVVENAPVVENLPQNEEAPDPGVDDLDDLDDLLDEFSAADIDQKLSAPRAPTSSGPGRPEQNPFPQGKAADGITEDFSKELQDQMAQLMGEIDDSPEMQKQLEDMMKELGESTNLETSAEDKGKANKKAANEPSATPVNPEESFQETIKKTMERMQASGESATAAVTDDSEDMLAAMMKEMQGGGEGGEEDFSKMLLGMMEQLTNKEILYEPMKELHDKFPGWMAMNKERTNAEDLTRYAEQQRVVGEIVGRFERPGYSDDNAEDREFIVERMQKMQAAGSPPADLVGNMKDAQDALGDIDPGCPQQ